MPCGRMIGISVDKEASRRPRYMLRRSLEQRRNKFCTEFERQLAVLEAKNQKPRSVVFTIFPIEVYWKLASSPLLLGQDGNDHITSESPLGKGSLKSSSPQPIILLHFNLPNEPKSSTIQSIDPDKKYSDNASNLVGDALPGVSSDFLVNSITKTGTNVKRAPRNKGKKKAKRQKRARCKKLSAGSEIQCEESMDATTAIDMTDSEALTLSPTRVIDMLFDDTSSPSSSVQEVSVEPPECENYSEYHDCLIASMSSASCGNDIEYSKPTTSYQECDMQVSNTPNYLKNASNSTHTPEVILSSSRANHRNGDSKQKGNHYNSSSILSNNCGAAVTDTSLDGSYSDVSGNFSDDTEPALIVRNECGCASPELSDFGDSIHGVDESCHNQSDAYFVGNNLCCSNDVSGACNGTQQVQFSSDASNSSDANDVSGACNGTQQVQFSSDFHLVVSRKRARRTRKFSLDGSFGRQNRYCVNIHDQNKKDTGHTHSQMVKELDTKDCIRKPSNRCNTSQHSVGLKDSKARVGLSHSAGMKENHGGKAQKCPNVDEVAKTSWAKVLHVIDSSRIPSISNDTGEVESGQMRSSSVSELTTKKFIQGNSSSGANVLLDCNSNAAQKGRLQPLLPMNGTARTNTELLSPAMPLPLESLRKFTNDVEQKPANKKEQSASANLCCMECRSGSQDVSPRAAVCSVNQLNNSSRDLPVDGNLIQNDSMLQLGAVPAFAGNQNLNKQSLVSSKKHLNEIIKAVNDACKVQVVAEGVNLVTGRPIADFETFIHSATPAISRIPCMKSCNICSPDQLVGNSLCQHQIPNVSLKSIWEWYEEPGCYGLEVKAQDYLNSGRQSYSVSDFNAYFVPYLSAVQLFGKPRENVGDNLGKEVEGVYKTSNTSNSLCSSPVSPMLPPEPSGRKDACLLESSSSIQDYGELLFEYFDSDLPSLRCPLFEKIKELLGGVKPSSSQIFGDSQKLENVRLADLHPASWFSVAWYPICRIPHGNFRAAFLTYHSLGKLFPQTCSSDMAGGLNRIVCPVVGLQNYNDKGEWWFRLKDLVLKSTSTEDAQNVDPSEVLKERLRTLRQSASVMARAVIPKGNGESVNRQPDYEFFVSRCN